MTLFVQTLTIKNRMKLLNVMVFIFIGLLVAAYSYLLLSIENKLLILEDFHDLFDNVLEVRRYEKNHFLRVGSQNVNKILEYLDKIDAELKKFNKNIVKVAGSEMLRKFQTNQEDYRSLLLASLHVDKSESAIADERVRQKGNEMVKFGKELLNDKQQRIRNYFKWIIFSFVLITGLFFIFIIIGLYSQARSVLKRISFVLEATKSVVKGSFQPIDFKDPEEDEITDLIRAFNDMASELDIKQEQLIQSRKLASIGTFSSGIAHELNNPLNNISLCAETLLEDGSDFTTEESRKIISDILLQTDRASEVVKNLLDFSRDKKPLTQLLNLKQVIVSTRKLIANELRLNAICLEDYVPESLPLIMGDLQKMQQVFLNLFVNSIHVMPKGGVISIDFHEDPPGYIRINVTDTGTGIKPENIENIFDPFYTTKEVGKGTGLGLSIVYGIVKKHNGYIEVKSKMGVGTTFSIFLPIAPKQSQ